MNPRFSITTPAYQAEATLQRAIDSVRAQTIGDWEHIIVDDGSTDSTLAIARAAVAIDPRVRSISVAHAGLVPTRRRAIAEASGTWIVRLDADDALAPDYLERVSEIIERHPEVDLVSTNGYQIMPNGERIPYYTAAPFDRETSLTLADMLAGDLFGTSAVARKAAIDAVGGPRIGARSEDVDLWLRMLASGARHVHLPASVFLYHQSPRQMSRDARAVWASHIEVVENLVATHRLSAHERRLARRMIRKNRLRLALAWDRWGLPLRRLLGGKGRV